MVRYVPLSRNLTRVALLNRPIVVQVFEEEDLVVLDRVERDIGEQGFLFDALNDEVDVGAGFFERGLVSRDQDLVERSVDDLTA
jgi:hypothetical protein